MVLSTDRSVIRLSHFVESEYDPALLIQPDPAHSIVNLKRMAQTTDTLFALYSNKTVRVLKLNTATDGADSARHHHRKHDNQPNLMLSVCTNKSCTIQSIVHEEAKRYGNTNGASGGRADGGTVAPRTTELDKQDSVMVLRPRFHHGQRILFFGSCHPDSLLSEQNFNEQSVVFQRAS
uniref:Uncharacterized protein n=1 Tax=Anopheles atroparvus TaxID=41427 RepID=A0A182JE05_ANOAO